MTTPQDAQQFPGYAAVEREGSKGGRAYLDAQTGLPLWVVVASGMFGSGHSMTAIHGPSADSDQVSQR